MNELPGEVGKLVAALGLLRTARRIAPARGHDPIRREASETHPPPED